MNFYNLYIYIDNAKINGNWRIINLDNVARMEKDRDVVKIVMNDNENDFYIDMKTADKLFKYIGFKSYTL